MDRQGHGFLLQEGAGKPLELVEERADVHAAERHLRGAGFQARVLEDVVDQVGERSRVVLDGTQRGERVGRERPEGLLEEHGRVAMGDVQGRPELVGEVAQHLPLQAFAFAELVDDPLGAQADGHPRHESLRSVALVVVSLDLELVENLLRWAVLRVRRLDDDLDQWVEAADGANELGAVHAGHDVVDDEQMDFAGQEDFERFLRGLGGEHAIPAPFELGAQEVERVTVVVDCENGVRVGGGVWHGAPGRQQARCHRVCCRGPVQFDGPASRL